MICSMLNKQAPNSCCYEVICHKCAETEIINAIEMKVADEGIGRVEEIAAFYKLQELIF